MQPGRDIAFLILLTFVLTSTGFILAVVFAHHDRDQFTLSDNTTQFLVDGNWTDIGWNREWTSSAKWQHFGVNDTLPNASLFMNLQASHFDFYMGIHPSTDVVLPTCSGFCISCGSDSDCCQVSGAAFCVHVVPNPCSPGPTGTEICALYRLAGESCDNAGFQCLPGLNCVGGFCQNPPTVAPTAAPTKSPTTAPTKAPTKAPTAAPTTAPTTAPTNTPTVAPTSGPTTAPTSAAPTAAPTNTPTTAPTNGPTTAPTNAPTNAPTTAPTATPTTAPTNTPTAAPTAAPTKSPTAAPTNAPTAGPTTAPTNAPTAAPTASPTASPTAAPTNAPTEAPTVAPTTAAPISCPTNPTIYTRLLVQQGVDPTFYQLGPVRTPTLQNNGMLLTAIGGVVAHPGDVFKFEWTSPDCADIALTPIPIDLGLLGVATGQSSGLQSISTYMIVVENA